MKSVGYWTIGMIFCSVTLMGCGSKESECGSASTDTGVATALGASSSGATSGTTTTSGTSTTTTKKAGLVPITDDNCGTTKVDTAANCDMIKNPDACK